MLRRISMYAWVAAALLTSIAAATPASAGERSWRHGGDQDGGVIQVACSNQGGTDCPTDINRNPRHYGQGPSWGDNQRRHFRRDDNWPRHGYRNDRPRHHYRHARPHFGGPIIRYAEPRYVEPRYVEPRRHRRQAGPGEAHVQWCYNRYRSYRAWDNSFQPYGGPRQQCWSPYS